MHKAFQKKHFDAIVKIEMFYLITPGKQQDLGAGVFSGGGDFDDDRLHHDCAVGEVLDGVTF